MVSRKTLRTYLFTSLFLYPLIGFTQNKMSIGDIIQKGPKYNVNDSWKEAQTFLPYEGKIIKSIRTIQLNFESGLENIDNQMVQQSSRFMDQAHHKTRPQVILKNLFIHVGDKLNPNLLADNERFLRTIPFLKDAKFVVMPIKNTDSVNLIVYTKDIFGYSGAIGGLGPSRQKLGLSNINSSGTGQNIGFNVMHDKNRNPSVGSEFYYGYQNLFGSFINPQIEIGTISKNIYDRKEDQFSLLFSLDHPLISQYKRWAGGIQIGVNNAQNRYSAVYNSGIYHYKSGNLDAWFGYNIDAKRYLKTNEIKLKKFIALSYFKNVFFENPAQIGQTTFDQRFNPNQGLLTSITFFKQYYFKAKYIYGFGKTEDIPAGYNATITTGYYEQLNLNRPFLGVNFYNYALTKNEDLTSIFLRTGGFYHNKSLQDLGILMGASIFSRIFYYKDIKIRNYVALNYSAMFNRVALDPLRINNTFGLYGFNSDQISGNQRISFKTENYYFLSFKLNGFNIAPITILDCSYLYDNNTSNNIKPNFYFSFGSGIRFKNENLGINTIEIRAIYLPVRLVGDRHFNFSIITDLDFKYRGNYITEPRIIELNSDIDNHIF